MENRDKEFFFEIRKSLSVLKNQVEELENKIASYEHLLDIQNFESKNIDINDNYNLEIEQETTEDFADEIKEELPEENEDEMVEELVEEPLEELKEELPEELVEELSEEGEDTSVKPLIIESPQTEQNEPAKEAVIDAYADRQSWRRDMPGSPVKDIRSAISLNDRILFINTLFDEDPTKFQDTVTEINTMTSFQEVINLIENNFPKWDLDSEVVYRFMMAVRRRVK